MAVSPIKVKNAESGESSSRNSRMGYAASSAQLSLLARAMFLGMVSENMNTNSVVTSVASTEPASDLNRRTAATVASADTNMYIRFITIRRVTIVRS